MKTGGIACGTLHAEAAPKRITEYQSLPAFALLMTSWRSLSPPIGRPSSGTSGKPRTLNHACPGKPPVARNTAVFLGLVG